MKYSTRAAGMPQQQPMATMPCTCGSFNGAPPFGMGSLLSQQQISPSTQTMQLQPMPTMPTGFPTGGTATPLLPAQGGTPAVPLSELPPTTVQSTLYTPGFLRTQIGRRMRVEFLIGTGALIDRTGTLLTVGASYILIRLVDSDDVMMCDIYSIKFVTIFH